MLLLFYIFCLAKNKRYKISKTNFFEDITLITRMHIFVFIRPTAAIFSLILLIFLIYPNIKKFIINEFPSKYLINILMISFGILLVAYNIQTTWAYSTKHVIFFAREGGTFFGYSREALRNKFNNSNLNIIESSKFLFYKFIWKITEFVSGMSDIKILIMEKTLIVYFFLVFYRNIYTISN